MLNLWTMRRGGAVAAPTGMIVLIAIGVALIDAGDAMDADARRHGEAVSHEVSTTTAVATYAAAGVGALVLLAGAGVAFSLLRDDEDEEEEIPVHRGGSPPAPGGEGIEL